MKRENARDGVCFLCGRDGTEDPLDFHHIFGGNAADRKKCERYGLKVRLCHGRCHIFGVAHVRDETPLTRQHELIGTHEYMAPELLLRGPCTPASDLYALGATMFEALTGRLPFDGPRPQVEVMPDDRADVDRADPHRIARGNQLLGTMVAGLFGDG